MRSIGFLESITRAARDRLIVATAEVLQGQRLHRAAQPRVSDVVVAGLKDDDVVVVDEIHDAVLLVDATRPRSGERMSELFGFAYAAKGSRALSSSSRLMRLRVVRSVVPQNT